MRRIPVSLFLPGLMIFLILTACSRKKTEVVWSQSLPGLGSQSSPRATDLNGDGALDLVIGAGKNENQPSDQGILAFDGITGRELWRQSSPDQVFGTATLYDVTGDGVDDVFIGGRSCHFKAMDGTNGEIIWSYEYKYQDDPILKHARFNFYSCVLTSDQSGDGLADLLVQNGGNSKIGPHVEEGRFPGVLMLMDSRSGAVIAADTMPDGKESYMTPLYFRQPDGEEYILFGSGGETIKGHLYLARLADLVNRDLSSARPIATEEGHGFIAPPVLADITGDGYLDVAAISHASTVLAIDGRSWEEIWRRQIPNTESSNSLAVGNFTGDDTPDFLAFVSKGVWPNNTGALHIALDGKDGSVVYEESLGCTGFSSPVVYDLNGDGFDEAIISINEYDCSRRFDDQSPLDITSKLIAVDIHNRRVNPIDLRPTFKNIFTTPWIGDLDQDGYLDIVHCQYYSPSVFLLAFLGMEIKRISTSIRVEEPVVWGAYLGSNGDGVFEANALE
jgi:outer membrane protein assembly factor BamB